VVGVSRRCYLITVLWGDLFDALFLESGYCKGRLSVCGTLTNHRYSSRCRRACGGIPLCQIRLQLS
jgi:hypothetical protein